MRALVFSKQPDMDTTFPPSHPRLLYGTAWKEDRTSECTFDAIEKGFTAFDTACQPRHYREDLVGDAVRKAFACGIFKTRAEIWVSPINISITPAAEGYLEARVTNEIGRFNRNSLRLAVTTQRRHLTT